MVTVWWSASLIIHYNFQNLVETITAEKYCQKINKIHQELQRFHLILVNGKGPILLHDNNQSHISQITLQKLSELGYDILPHPAYSSDCSLVDSHFFKHLSTTSCSRGALQQPSNSSKTPSKNSLVVDLQNSMLLE